MYTTEFIGRRLYLLWVAVGMSVLTIAGMTEVTEACWRFWETGRTPSLKLLINICNHTGIDIESFLTGESWLDDLTPDSPGVSMIRDKLEETL